MTETVPYTALTDDECHKVAKRLGGSLRLVALNADFYTVEVSYSDTVTRIPSTRLQWALCDGVRCLARLAGRFDEDNRTIDLSGLPEDEQPQPTPPAIPAGLTVPQWAMIARLARCTNGMHISYATIFEHNDLLQLRTDGLVTRDSSTCTWRLTDAGRALADRCLAAQTLPEPLPYSESEIAGLLFWGIRANVCSAAQLRGLLDDRNEMTDLGKQVLPEALRRLCCEPNAAPIEVAPAPEPTPGPDLTDAEKALLIDLRKRGGAMHSNKMTTEQIYALVRTANWGYLTCERERLTNVGHEWHLTDKGRFAVDKLVPGLTDHDAAALRYVQEFGPYHVDNSLELVTRKLISYEGHWWITDLGRDALAIYDTDHANGGA